MMNSKDLLGSVVKTAQMGQAGLQSVLEAPLQPALREELQRDAAGYDQIEQAALELAVERNWRLRQLGPVSRACSKMVARARLLHGDTDSKTAAMVIQGNIRGLVKGTRNLHRLSRPDTEACKLAQRLLDAEEDSIRRMQAYL